MRVCWPVCGHRRPESLPPNDCLARNGLAALMAVLVFNTIVNVIAEKAWGLPQGIWDIRDAYPWLGLLGMWPSAIFCWYYGKRLKEQAVREAVLGSDPATGQQSAWSTCQNSSGYPCRGGACLAW